MRLEDLERRKTGLYVATLTDAAGALTTSSRFPGRRS
jgi:hypothetical protein